MTQEALGDEGQGIERRGSDGPKEEDGLVLGADVRDERDGAEGRVEPGPAVGEDPKQEELQCSRSQLGVAKFKGAGVQREASLANSALPGQAPGAQPTS